MELFMTLMCGVLAGLNFRYLFRKDFTVYGKIGAAFYATIFLLVALGFAR